MHGKHLLRKNYAQTKESLFFNLCANRVKAMVSDNALIEEYLIGPLKYHWYTYPFLRYSVDILLYTHFKCILINVHVF